MNNIKHGFFSVISYSLLIETLAFIITIPWLSDIITNLFNNIIGFYLLSLLFIFIVLVVIIFLIFLCISYDIENNCIKKKIKFFIYRKVKYLYFDNNEIIVRRKQNFILSFFYLKKLEIYYKGKKIFSLIIDDDSLDAILIDTLNIVRDEKIHFEKNTDYYSDYLSIFYLILNNLYNLVMGLLIYLFIINLLNFTYFYIGDNKISLVVIGLVVFPIIFILLSISTIFGVTVVNTKIENDSIHVIKGFFQRSESYIPKKMVLNSTIKLGILSTKFNCYSLFLKEGRFRLNIPLHKENIDTIFLRNLDFEKVQNYINLPEIIIISIINALIFTGLFFINRFAGTIFFITSSIIVFNMIFVTGIELYDDIYIIINGFIIKRIRIFDKNIVKNIRIKTIMSLFSFVIIETNNKKYIYSISKKNSINYKNEPTEN